MTALLEVEDLAVHFASQGLIVRAVDGVSFTLDEGQTLGIVGESGSGKSVTALALMGLVPAPPGRIASGSIRFRGREMLSLPPRDLRSIRGREIAMIFQDPMTSLNPVLTIGRQLTEVLEVHMGASPSSSRAQAIDLLALVGIPEPEKRLGEYPHRLSGGMRQRVMIAMAVACKPRLLIADEPTTALDVTIQAQILELLRSLQRDLGMALIMITHDLGVVAGLADRVNVMYAGRVVEEGDADGLFAEPKMPYTVGLMRSLPRLDRATEKRLTPIRGLPPVVSGEARYCRFAPRCDLMFDKCLHAAPPLIAVGEGRRVACWKFESALPRNAVS